MSPYLLTASLFLFAYSLGSVSGSLLLGPVLALFVYAVFNNVIDEEQVLLRVVGQALFERDVEQVAAQPHRRVGEDARVHQRRRTFHDRHEIHAVEDVALQVHTGRDLDQLEPFLAQAEHAALGHVEHVPLPLDRL